MTDRQDELLAKHDGRYYAIDKFNTGLALLVKTEKLGKRDQVDFGLPSSSALFLSAARRSFLQIKDIDPSLMFYEWQYGRIPINHSKLFDYFEAFASHVVFSFTALEAFANESIPTDFEYQSEKKCKSIVLAKPDIERNINLDEKLHLVLPRALGVTTPKGKKSWQQYKLLKGMRDRIIHLKTIDRTPSGPEKESVWGIMLRAHGEPFCDYAHAMMGHYLTTSSRRWHREYPYRTVEPDKISGDQ
jgi:hypothetical protein